ncbi:hypothetical protein EJ08DRAFT_72362 [Tothia fuscella]|uniref:Uncharacterized protein n=1 Tax=Tothia fuscella TaxID=1048955 RepID=A0A9P4U101_9PEZI|nr:hypothetical protein EJ08DRAFT_72362 [Tothia fuscella]
MRYIRFLKPPKIKGNTITALITITSDLGESFFSERIQLTGAIHKAVPNGEIYQTKMFKWEEHMRSLVVEFNIKNSDIGWPARLHVSLRNVPHSDHFGKHDSGINLPNIVSAWSDILDPTEGISEATRTVERRFTALNGRVINIWEETGESIARHLWDAGIALSAHLDRMVFLEAGGISSVEQLTGSATFKRLHVLELGAGCGIVGISFAQLIPDCEVTLTDLPEATEIIQRNIEGINPAMNSSVKFQPLNWDDPLPSSIENGPVDLVLVADCTYNPDSSPALVKTFGAIVRQSPKAAILIAMKIRHEGELVFFYLMKNAGFVKDNGVKILLPDLLGAQEQVEIYVFHHQTRPSYS